MQSSSEETLAIFGATGKTGLHVVHTALEKYRWKVKAMVRTPSKLKSIIQHDNLNIIEGDFTNREAIRATLEGCTRVICCAGGPHSNQKYPKKFMLKFVKQELWPAVQESKPVSLLFQAGALSKRHRFPPFQQLCIAPFMGLYPMAKDNDAVLRFIHKNPLTNIGVVCTRPGFLLDSKGGDSLYAHAYVPNQMPLAFRDLARFNLEAVLDETLLGKYPYVRSRKK